MKRFAVLCSFYLIVLGFYYYTSFCVSKFHVHIDNRFTEQEREIILDSLKEWNESTEGIAKFEDIRYETPEQLNKYQPKGLSFLRRDLFLIKVKDHTEDCIFWGELKDIEVGSTVLYYSGNAVECLDSPHAMKMQYFRRVVLHETGHALGLRFPGVDHNHDMSEEDSVMHPDIIDETNYISCSDLFYFCRVYNCNFGCK